MSISRDAVITALVMFVVGLLTAVVVIWVYLDEKPRISAVGDYATWTAPLNQDFGSFRTYAQIDVRNVGNAAAKDISLQTPFSGIYAVDTDSANPKEFDKNFSIPDLNPGSGYIVKIWARYSQSLIAPEILITHTRGSQNVDFGYTAKGFIGRISERLDFSWPGYVLLFLIVLLILWAYIHDLKTKIKANDHI